MHPDFQAFASSVVLESVQKKIEVLEAWGDRAFAGLADSTLMVLQPSEGAGNGPWQVTQALKQFSKKPLVQIQVQIVLQCSAAR